ncbi:MAG: class I SAM-dependent methyltransferase [Planctomycetaceae bacterium]|jgi:SAM-dependent methyltransferase|nr:class I SAM-dependent methyltransferase [Planctomycetaceae bacterium]
MNFKYYVKCRWWNWLVGLPFGDRLYLAGKKLLGQYPIAFNVSDIRFHCAERFRDTYIAYISKPIQDASVFEFGSGYELFITMCMASFGFKNIHAVDRINWTLPSSLNFAAEHVKKRTDYPSILSSPPRFNRKNYKQTLLDYYHIDFHAPSDARKTLLSENSIDYIYTNDVLEHIPQEDIKSILIECQRILLPGGIIAFAIDYKDHCRDEIISPYYFLQFSLAEWNKIYPPGGHNRMRHIDYKYLFEDAGFEILEEKAISPFTPDILDPYHDPPLQSSTKLIEILKSMPIAKEFSNYPIEELAKLTGYWILRKPYTQNKL